MPKYSLENPTKGATIAYIGRKIIHIMKEPGMANIVHFVQVFVTKAALPITVRRTAVYSVVPQTQCPATWPFDSIPSLTKKYVDATYAMAE
jgi:hypothetical protein